MPVGPYPDDWQYDGHFRENFAQMPDGDQLPSTINVLLSICRENTRDVFQRVFQEEVHTSQRLDCSIARDWRWDSLAHSGSVVMHCARFYHDFLPVSKEARSSMICSKKADKVTIKNTNQKLLS